MSKIIVLFEVIVVKFNMPVQPQCKVRVCNIVRYMTMYVEGE